MYFHNPVTQETTWDRPAGAHNPRAPATVVGGAVDADRPMTSPRLGVATHLDEHVATTQALLGSVITTPQLSTALLIRPPFQFMHDIVTEVTRATGFAEGVFQGDELHAETIQGRSAKEEYLGKICKYVKDATGEALEMSPAKVVAGKDPENTNLFLQALARAAGGGAGKELLQHSDDVPEPGPPLARQGSQGSAPRASSSA